MLNTDKIKSLRKAQHQSKAKLAGALHMTLKAYSVLENSSNLNINLSTILQLAEYLGVSPMSLLAIPAEAGPNILAELTLLQIEKKRWKQKLLRDLQ